MNLIGLVIGIACGALGVLLSLVAGITRLMGTYHMFGFETAALLQAGTALMVLACMVRLYTQDNKQS